MDLGLLSLRPAHITGIDVHVRPFDVVEHAAHEVARHGHNLPADYKNRLSYIAYSGRKFPFPDNTFDLVFSWGTFEHIRDVKTALSEARRVVKPDGRIFIDVYPWFHSYQGSHLADFISEPYFQLNRPKSWVLAKLKEYLAAHLEQADVHLDFWRPEGYSFQEFVLEHMYGEYCNLNRCSASEFLQSALQLDLMIERLETNFEDHPEASKISGVPYADLITAGTTVLFRSGKNSSQLHKPRSWHKFFAGTR